MSGPDGPLSGGDEKRLCPFDGRGSCWVRTHQVIDSMGILAAVCRSIVCRQSVWEVGERPGQRWRNARIRINLWKT